MNIQEVKTRTITLDSADIKQAIIFYLKNRGENNIDETKIELAPNAVSATIVLTQEITPQ